MEKVSQTEKGAKIDPTTNKQTEGKANPKSKPQSKQMNKKKNTNATAEATAEPKKDRPDTKTTAQKIDPDNAQRFEFSFTNEKDLGGTIREAIEQIQPTITEGNYETAQEALSAFVQQKILKPDYKKAMAYLLGLSVDEVKSTGLNQKQVSLALQFKAGAATDATDNAYTPEANAEVIEKLTEQFKKELPKPKMILSDEDKERITALVKTDPTAQALQTLGVAEIADFTKIVMSVFSSIVFYLQMPDKVAKFLTLLIGKTKPNSVIVEASNPQLARESGIAESSLKNYVRATKNYMLEQSLGLIRIEAIPNEDRTKTAFTRYTLDVLSWIHEIVRATLETGNASVFSAFLYIQGFDDERQDKEGKTKRQKAFEELPIETQEAIFNFQTRIESRLQEFAELEIIVKEDKSALQADVKNLTGKIETIAKQLDNAVYIPEVLADDKEVKKALKTAQNVKKALSTAQAQVDERREQLEASETVESLTAERQAIQDLAEQAKTAEKELRAVIASKADEKIDEAVAEQAKEHTEGERFGLYIDEMSAHAAKIAPTERQDNLDALEVSITKDLLFMMLLGEDLTQITERFNRILSSIQETGTAETIALQTKANRAKAKA